MIRLTSAGPVIFAQERIGLNGRRFVMLKFRTMRHAVENRGSCSQAIRQDPRVTRIGTLLRRSSFDEVPQLLNVLAGSMSLVGPRPHAPGTCAAGRPFETVTHRYAARHSVKPGMTGLAQVRGWRGETDTEEKLIRRIDSDLEYIATWSLGGDLWIICRTIVTVMRMRNAY
jgi:lipopolysaccharide/colanic/teichoic acid biosynthesis glycosyltransferase